MPTTNLQLTPQELKDIVNPTGSSDGWRYGSEQGLMTEAKALNLLQVFGEDWILDRLPESYGEIIRGRVDGEHLTETPMGARAGQTALQTTFYPIESGSLRLYKNFNFQTKNWRNRSYSDDSLLVETTDYTVDEATGAITLVSALSNGDRVIADYKHTGGSLISTVRVLALKAARIELYTQFPKYNENNDNLNQLQQNIIEELESFYAPDGSARGINYIDKMVMVRDTRKSKRKGYRMPFLRGQK